MPITHENYVHSKDIDLTRGFTWDAAVKKLWVDLSKVIDNDYLIVNPQSGKTTVNPQKFDNLKEHLKNLLELVKQGLDNRIDGTNDKLNDLKDTLERLIVRLEREGNPVKTKPNGGLVGNGTAQDPLGLNLNTGDLVINSAGQLELAVKKPSVLTNLNNNLTGLGFHTFSGFINNTNGNTQFVQGVPRDYESQAPKQAAAGSITDLAPNQVYDFNGYYVASEHEVIMTILNNGVTWTRSNDAGMNPNGTIKDEGAWGEWKRETNINITVELIEQHTRQIQDLLDRMGRAEPKITTLENKVNTLETQTIPNLQQQLQQQLNQQIQNIQQQLQMPCEMNTNIVGSHTITNNDNVILSNGGTITIPNGLPNGRMFTVIQAGAGKVTLQGDGHIQVTAPLDGSLILAGVNAVVSILIINNEARVFGQTE